MKKILFYLSGIYSGGTEIETLELIKKLHKESQYQLFYSYYDIENSYEPMVKNFNSYAKYIDINVSTEVDTIIYCTDAIKDYDKIEKNITYNKSYFWFHYFWQEQDEFLEIILKNKKFKKVIAVSKYVKEKLLINFPQLNENQVVVIYNILDEIKIKQKSNEKLELKRGKQLTLLTIARFSPIKGYHRVKYLIDLLKKESIDFEWYILGRGSNKKAHNDVEDLLKDYKEVHLMGYIENPYPYIKNCDYVVLMSDRETYGLVITEAKIIGTPCIVTDFEAVYEQIQEGINGIILERDNMQNYINRIPDILTKKNFLKENLRNFNYPSSETVKQWEALL